MKSMHCFLVLCLAAAVVSPAFCQDNNSPPPPCPFAADDVKGLDLTQIKNGCDAMTSSPSGDACDACSASLVRTLKPLFPKFNVPYSNAKTAIDFTEEALLVTLRVCTTPVLSTLEGAGISIDKLGYLSACPDGGSTKELLSEAQKVCPDLPAGGGN